MARLTPFYFIPALIAAVSHAEITIEPRPFSIENLFSAVALPAVEGVLLKLEPQVWEKFEITQIAAHGSKLAKGELLIRFDAEDIDHKIDDTRRQLKSGALVFAQAELDFTLLQASAADKLTTFRRAAEIAKEENHYFSQVRRKAKEDTASQALKRSEQILANQREELKQLAKMYAADDITESTEEIILVRQQDAVAAAEFALRMENLDHQRTLEVSLPREAIALAETERDTAISLKKAEVEIPRSLELSQLALEAQRSAQQRATQQLAQLEADRRQFEFKAPADGWFYHGPIENGRWTPAEVVKTLIHHGHPPIHNAFATFIPAGAKLNLVAFVNEATARALQLDLAGTATLAGREDLQISVKLLKLAAAPSPDGTYRTDLAVTWPQELTPVVGATAQIRLISYHQAAAIVIPTQALTLEADAWTVSVKLADGKTERRPVKRGRIHKEDSEILSGLEIGQVVVIPGDK